MDIPRGRCWRCEEKLPSGRVMYCDYCPQPVYCDAACRERDRIRHRAVECEVFGTKKCSECGCQDDVKECAQCSNAWYCNRECQVSNWKEHKQACSALKSTIKSLASMLGRRNTSIGETERTSDPPYYFGNTIARDFLRLLDIEWSDEKVKRELARDFHVLSAGCGDLRSTVLTVGSLPDEYTGKLYITLNDFDPFVMARNVLFLYMLARFADTEGIESSLTTIWYSLHIKKKEFDLIVTCLDELIPMDMNNLRNSCKGLINVHGLDMEYLRQVWQGWRSLNCQRDQKTSINLRKQRREIFAKEDERAIPTYLSKLSKKDKKLMESWFDHGLFLPSEVHQSTIPFDNPTLTGRTSLATFYACDSANVRKAKQKAHGLKAPEEYTFQYCIRADSFPFMVWDCLRVKESVPRPGSSPMVMYHTYVTSLLLKMKSLITQERLCLHVSLANCLDFPNHHKNLRLPNYDRIFTSNLVDYVGFAKILRTFKPLLNRQNTFSAIVTETTNWFLCTPGADVMSCQDSKDYVNCVSKDYSDTRKANPFCNPREYFNSTPHFLAFLRADIMGGGLSIDASENIPSLNAAMTYNGMQMNDFRKTLNRLVPFQYRVNARDLTMMNGADRAVEWYLPQPKPKTLPPLPDHD
ncbi:uncharacterized protein LOC117296920 [Asterias rubens]|uniref:uncharacterized protein LOC117296920 n=1 Tax=Asterias rubens TaxID=7604 RepID=UPI001454E865|nr:uncharacterized protein LOC117296920 [Asterias rubens]XP_033635917.1 uncharacterized protein LOC117296920 [Asterias rubens]